MTDGLPEGMYPIRAAADGTRIGRPSGDRTTVSRPQGLIGSRADEVTHRSRYVAEMPIGTSCSFAISIGV
jgi:hypothetical protein